MSAAKLAPLALVALTSLALAAGTRYNVIVNGEVLPKPAVVMNGEAYVPLSALKSLGVTSSLKGSSLTLRVGPAPSAGVTPGGANQRASLEGCLGETLFNGIWRLRATKLEAIKRDPGTPAEAPGWGLTVELRNGARGTLIPAADTGVRGNSMLAFADAQTLSVEPLSEQKLTFANLPQGGVVTAQLRFYYPYDIDRAKVQKPVKFLFEIDPQGFESAIRGRAGGATYTTSTPSFRVRLDCQK